ncbi:MAG: pyocin activator protein PrtN [Gammaproteobacteria bacterium]|nr:pyocin activator protein PrtN [Gammaproteobacteria bacterium]
MNTTFLLLAEYNTSDIPLAVVAAKYLGLNERVAAGKASRGELPFPAYRPGSQKSPWLVNVADLAAWLDSERAKAVDEARKRYAGDARFIGAA